jgi:glutamyl-tRNA reductase
MLERFRAISISYKTAPLRVREQFALAEQEASQYLQNLSQVLGLTEVMVVSTCNRSEIYYLSEEDKTNEIISLLQVTKGLAGKNFYGYFSILNNAPEAIQHLFRMSLGLESQVVGDFQIINQVKRAYQLTADLQLAGPVLHRLLHMVFFANKRVAQETNFRDGAASVSYAAVEMLREFAKDIKTPNVLVVGLGEIGQDVVKNLQNSNLKNITICNRTFAKAEKLANECGYKTLPFEQVWQGVAEADIIVSSVVAHTPFFTLEQKQVLLNKPNKLLVDLSVPRSADAALAELKQLLVLNVDQVHLHANQALEQRKQAIPKIEKIIEEQLNDVASWSREMSVTPALHKIKASLEQIRKDEIDRYMRELDEHSLPLVEKVTTGMLNKIMRVHAVQLRTACQRGDAEQLAEVLQQLFNVEKQPLPAKP